MDRMTVSTFQPSTIDSFIYQNAPNTNYGTHNALELYDYTNYVVRSLLKFDISSVISEGATINSAIISIYYKRLQTGINPYGKLVDCCRITQPAWTETGVTWNKYDGTNSWGNAGGDYTETDKATTQHPAIYNWMNFTVTDQVQYAVDYVDRIAHFLIKFQNEALSSGYSLPEYHSREYTTNPTLCPKLVIDWTLPAAFKASSSIIPLATILDLLVCKPHFRSVFYPNCLRVRRNV